MTLDELKKELLKDEKFRKEYNRYDLPFEINEMIIDARVKPFEINEMIIDARVKLETNLCPRKSRKQ